MSEQQTNKDKPGAETSQSNEKSTGNNRRGDRRGDRMDAVNQQICGEARARS